MGFISEFFTAIKAGAVAKAEQTAVDMVCGILSLFGHVGFGLSLAFICAGFFALMFGTTKPLKWGFILLMVSIPFLMI